jgi:myo-inositol 2-dehydrogenase / D-chiro-inositol 1-dehydrogenase
VVDADLSRAKKAAEATPPAAALADIGPALDREDVSAVVIATPGFLHKEMLLQVLERRLPILCEKPLTPDAASSWEIVEAEQRFGKKCIQVGFMRRFDAEYQRLRKLIMSGELGELLMLHCSHRNPEAPHGFTNEMLINDSVVHEFDVIRYLTGEEINTVQVRLGRASRHAPSGQHDPQHVLIETEGGVLADVEIFVNAQFGYQVATQAVFEKGIVNIGEDSGPYVRAAGRWGARLPRVLSNRSEALTTARCRVGLTRPNKAKLVDPPLGMAIAPRLAARPVWPPKGAARRSKFLCRPSPTFTANPHFSRP